MSNSRFFVFLFTLWHSVLVLLFSLMDIFSIHPSFIILGVIVFVFLVLVFLTLITHITMMNNISLHLRAIAEELKDANHFSCSFFEKKSISE